MLLIASPTAVSAVPADDGPPQWASGYLAAPVHPRQTGRTLHGVFRIPV